MPLGTTSDEQTGSTTARLLNYQNPIETAVTRFRWVILALVFFGTTVNYMDRQILSILAPDLKKSFAITDVQYGYMQAAFALSYAIGQLFSGRWIDWIGTRVGYAAALTAWSLTSILHIFARTAAQFSLVRGLLGVSESPNFPAAVKTLAEWFPKRERAMAMGWVNTGCVVGAVMAPLVVPWLSVHYGWQSAFIVTGVFGLVWLVFWIPIYRRPEEHPRVSPGELAYIHSDPPEPTTKLRWALLVTYPQAWAFMIGKFITDPLWWFYMTWFPSFLHKQYGLDLLQLGKPLIVVYAMASVGGVVGGWLSSALIRAGWSINAARKTALFVCALCVVPVVFASHVSHMWTAVFLMGLCTASHQGFSSNLYTLVSDMFPKQATGSVSGLGGTFGYVGASLFSSLTGLIVGRWTNQNYGVVFLIAGLGYLVAFAAIQILAPKMAPAILPEGGSRGFEVMPAGDNAPSDEH